MNRSQGGCPAEASSGGSPLHPPAPAAKGCSVAETHRRREDGGRPRAQESQFLLSQSQPVGDGMWGSERFPGSRGCAQGARVGPSDTLFPSERTRVIERGRKRPPLGCPPPLQQTGSPVDVAPVSGGSIVSPCRQRLCPKHGLAGTGCGLDTDSQRRPLPPSAGFPRAPRLPRASAVTGPQGTTSPDLVGGEGAVGGAWVL